MEQQMHQIVNDVYSDLAEACAASGETLCAEGLADFVGDRMIDSSDEYRAMPYPQRRAIVLRVCQQYA